MTSIVPQQAQFTAQIDGQDVACYKSDSIVVEYHKESTVIRLVQGHNFTIEIPDAKPIQVEVPKKSLR